MRGRYATVPYPWRAAIDRESAPAARFYASLVRQALRNSLPAARRAAPVRVALARTGIPVGLSARAMRALPGRERGEIDGLVEQALAAWPQMAAASERLPHTPPARPGVLALERRSALTVFLFGHEPWPLVVLKRPAAGADARVAAETRALDEAAPAGVAPRPLGDVGGAAAQEGLPGEAPAAAPLRLRDAGRLGWPAPLDPVCDALDRLAAATAKPGFPAELEGPLERALSEAPLEARARERLAEDWAAVRSLRTSVLRHRDTSPQNCLFHEGGLTGLVDWEGAVSAGAPGYDVLNAAMAWLDYGLGLVRFSQDIAVSAFQAALGSPLMVTARIRARRSMEAAGVPAELHAPLETVFLGWRVGRRLEDPAFYPTTAHTAARMLAIASER